MGKYGPRGMGTDPAMRNGGVEFPHPPALLRTHLFLMHTYTQMRMAEEGGEGNLGIRFSLSPF